MEKDMRRDDRSQLAMALLAFFIDRTRLRARLDALLLAPGVALLIAAPLSCYAHTHPGGLWGQ